MPKRLRHDLGGMVYHVLNRANARMMLFESHDDYQAFEKILTQAHEQVPMRTLAYCLMPNHWHFVLWPREDGHMAEFMHWLTVTHVRRWHAYRGTEGTGHVYQDRYKSFPIQEDNHFITVCRYVERNPLRANVAAQADEWPWSSLARRASSDPEATAWLAEWPVARPRNWHSYVTKPVTDAEREALALSIKRGRPFGSDEWARRTAKKLGIESTLRPRGRPPKR